MLTELFEMSPNLHLFPRDIIFEVLVLEFKKFFIQEFLYQNCENLHV